MNRFDEPFRESLLETIKSNRLPVDICRALQVDTHSRPLRSHCLRRFIYRFNSVSLIGLCNFMRINPFVNLECLNGQKLTVRQRLKRLFRDSDKTTSERWPYALVLIAVVSTSMSLVNMYYKYIYDANKIRLIKLQEQLNNTDKLGLANHMWLKPSEADKLRHEWQQRASEARETLELLGSPFLEWPLLVQSVILSFMASGFNAYVVVPIIYRLSDMIIPLPTALVDHPGLNYMRAQLILGELDKYSLDCLSFARTKLEQVHKELTQTFGDSDEQILGSDLISLRHKALESFAVKLRQKHLTTVEQLKRIALEGRLNSFNTRPVSRDQLALTYFLGLLSLVAYVQIVLTVTYGIGRAHFGSLGFRAEINNFKDIADIFNSLVIVEVTTCSGVGLLVIFTVILFDNIGSIIKLRIVISHVIENNEIRFKQLLDLSLHSVKSSEMVLENARKSLELSRDFELDLMMVILQNRLITRMVELARRPLVAISTLLLQFAVTTPTVFRIHSAYFETDLRVLSLAVGLVCTSLSLILLAPLGLMHKKGIETHKKFWSLAAQLSYSESVKDINKCLKIDSSVAAFTLRRELADSRQTTDKFACRVLSVPVTYENLVKISFWILLIMVSLSNNINIFGNKIVQFLSDPFDLYSSLRPPKPD